MNDVITPSQTRSTVHKHVQVREYVRALVGDGHGMEIEYRRAIRLFPYDAGMTLTIADEYTRAGLWKPAADLNEAGGPWGPGTRP